MHTLRRLLIAMLVAMLSLFTVGCGGDDDGGDDGGGEQEEGGGEEEDD
jgi:hypothetical protein